MQRNSGAAKNALREGLIESRDGQDSRRGGNPGMAVFWSRRNATTLAKTDAKKSAQF
jgi:hypothetical protein